ncbi:hypothetical protein IJ531_03970, partial [bacterium]|nr:hypothetical protein [bacterium]
FCQFNCNKLKEEFGMIYFFIKTGSIYPWNLEYYSALGVNNFKFSALAAMGSRANPMDMNYLKRYLEVVEYGIKDKTVEDFFNNIFTFDIARRRDLKLADLKEYLPDIKHFVKNGDKCALRCKNDCFYCDMCAKRVENFING